MGLLHCCDRILLACRRFVLSLPGLTAVAALGCHEYHRFSPQLSGLSPFGTVAGRTGYDRADILGGILSYCCLGSNRCWVYLCAIHF